MNDKIIINKDQEVVIQIHSKGVIDINIPDSESVRAGPCKIVIIPIERDCGTCKYDIYCACKNPKNTTSDNCVLNDYKHWVVDLKKV
jgi:hypothetical protein